MKRPTRVTRGSFLVTSLRGGRIGLVGVHRAELVDLDQLVVEAVALLLEEHRPAAVELDGERDERHHRQRRSSSASAADDLVEQPLHHDVPVGDRLVEHVEHRHVADVGIGARAEAQLVGVRREADVDRQHPELLEHLQDAALGRDRQREDHEVDARAAGEFDEVVDRAELGDAGAAVERGRRCGRRTRRGRDVGIVAGASSAWISVLAVARRRRRRRCGDRAGPGASTGARGNAGSRGPPSTPPDRRERTTRARRAKFGPHLHEKGCPDEQQERECPGRCQPGHLAKLPPEDLDIVDFSGLETHHGCCCYADDRREKSPVKSVERFGICKVHR